MANFCIKCGNRLDAEGMCTACTMAAAPPPLPPLYGVPPATQSPHAVPSPQYPGYGMPPQQPQSYAPPAMPQQPAYSAPQVPNYSVPAQLQYSAPPVYGGQPAQPQLPMYGAPSEVMPYQYYPQAEQKPRGRREKIKYDDSHLPLYGSSEMLGQTLGQEEMAVPTPAYQENVEPVAQNEPIDDQILTEPAKTEQE